MITYSTSVIFLTILQYLQNSCKANNTIADVNIWDSSVRFADEGESEWFKLAAVGIKDYDYDWNAMVPFCSGVLITKKHVITSAHCMMGINYPVGLRVRIGSVNFQSAKQYHIRYWTTYQIWANENGIGTGSYEHDICIIKLSDKAPRSTIPGVITKRTNEFFFNRSVETVFWGIRDRILGYAKVGVFKVISNDECANILKNTSTVPKNITLDRTIFCTKLNRAVVLENVDSGSPLLYEKNEVIAINDPTYLQRKGVHAAVDLNFHLGLTYYKTFIQNVTKTEKAKWWKIWKRN